MRISDTEREQAIQMLGEHMSVGRLDVEEYGERTARATAAKTRGELSDLFTDLPQPRPTFGPDLPAPTQPAVPLPPPRSAAPAKSGRASVGQRVWGALVPLSAIVALILFLTLIKVWFIFLLPAALAIIGGAIWGDDRHHDHFDRRMHRRQLRRGWHD
jgi:hypothetical protein